MNEELKKVCDAVVEGLNKRLYGDATYAVMYKSAVEEPVVEFKISNWKHRYTFTTEYPADTVTDAETTITNFLDAYKEFTWIMLTRR